MSETCIKDIAHIKGLTSREVKKRFAKYGPNVIYKEKRLSPLLAFVKKFNSPVLLMLIITALISLFLGQTSSASIILVMVVASAVMDFVNTRKSEDVAAKLISQVASTATVMRDGVKKEISLHELVPGDIVSLSAGDIVPADSRVLSANDFFVNQSSLTGESFPVEKYADAEKCEELLEKDPASALLSSGAAKDELSLSSDKAVFMGTSVVTGYATVMVLRTGSHAEFGRIAERLASVVEETDFERGIRKMSLFIIRLTFFMVVAVFAMNAMTGRGILDSFLFSIAIAVGLTPELLPVIMSVSLAHGSLVMAKKKVIVKNLSSIQNFGSMDILCTDKTGTLTEDHIILVKCLDRNGKDSEDVMLNTYLSSVMRTAVRSPLDSAIQEHGKMDVSHFSKVDEVPFDFHRRRDSVVVDSLEERTFITKGAPESIFSVCTSYLEDGKVHSFTDAHRAEALKEFETLSADGYRVLAIAKKNVPQETRAVYNSEEEKDLMFLGFAAFLDPPKQSVVETLKDLQELHIEIKIVTGDTEILTAKICRELNLPVRGVLTSAEVAELSDSELGVKAEETTIFARVSPEQKERIVSILRKRGHVVGYMGDGINDAPVLKAADVGISVNNAVDVVKETADIILLEKNLTVLKDGVEEGRKTFQNTLKYIKMGFSSNFGNMFSMMGATAFLPFLPMLPGQILFNNFLYDMSQTTLSGDNIDEQDIQKPLRWDNKFFGRYLFVFGLVSSVFDFITFFVLYKVFDIGASGFQTGWFIESIATQVLIVYVIRTKRIPFFRSWPSRAVVFSTLGVVTLAWITPFTALGGALSFVALPVPILLSIAGIVGVYLVVGEGAKWVFYKVNKNAP